MVKKSELTKEYYKSGEVGRMIGRSSRSVQNYAKAGEIEYEVVNKRFVYPRKAVIDYIEGLDLLDDDDLEHRIDVVYARVSSHGQKKDLERQKEKILIEVASRNPKNIEVITEIASGLNDNRRGLNKLLKLVMVGKVDRIFISYKDRLTRFGFNYLETVCNYQGTKIVVLGENPDKTIEQELADDIISIIQSFSGKLYGLRRRVKGDINTML